VEINMKKNDLIKLSFATLTLPGAGSNLDKGIAELIVFYIEKYLLPITMALALGAIIYGGTMYIMAGGDDEKTKNARHIITIAVVGVILLALSVVIINWIQQFWNEVL
jgi:energy-converting hydrogenase Eha subunit F